MTDTEFETIALALKAAYPSSNVLPDKYAMKTWYRALSDLDYRVIENAVWEHISTSVFPPSIAEIRGKCTDRLTPMITDWGEAWEEVQRAIRRFGSYREGEAVASLSKLTATAVRRLGFLNLCRSDNPVADRANFRMIYEGMVKEEKRQTQLPGFVREAREHMIECNKPPVLQVESGGNECLEAQGDVRAAPERIDELLKSLKRSMIGRASFGEDRK